MPGSATSTDPVVDEPASALRRMAPSSSNLSSLAASGSSAPPSPSVLSWPLLPRKPSPNGAAGRRLSLQPGSPLARQSPEEDGGIRRSPPKIIVFRYSDFRGQEATYKFFDHWCIALATAGTPNEMCYVWDLDVDDDDEEQLYKWRYVKAIPANSRKFGSWFVAGELPHCLEEEIPRVAYGLSTVLFSCPIFNKKEIKASERKWKHVANYPEVWMVQDWVVTGVLALKLSHPAWISIPTHKIDKYNFMAKLLEPPDRPASFV